MITTLEHGITNHDTAEGSIIQSTSVKATKQVDEVSGMVTGKTQIVQVFEHTEVNEFSVEGKGDLTLEPGVGEDPFLTLITGGVVFIADFEYKQAIGTASSWSYSGKHYPHAA